MNVVSPNLAAFYQDTIIHVPSVGTKVPLESESRMLKTTPDYARQAYSQPAHAKNQREARYIQAGLQYTPQNHAGAAPVLPSYLPTCLPMPHQQNNNPYQPCQTSVLPARPPQSYITPKKSNVFVTTAMAPMLPVHPHVTMVAPQVAYKEVVEATKGFQTGPILTSLSPPLQLVDRSDKHNPLVLSASADYDKNYEEELAYTAIYKTQPPARIVKHQ